MPIWLQAGFWGLIAGGALVVGAAIAWFVKVPKDVVASIMAFGAGVLISALAFDLVDEAESTGGLTATLVGFLGGAVVYLAANVVLARRGARHRKRSGDQQPSESDQQGSGAAIALGGKGVGVGVLVAIFISNLPEGLSSAAGMKRSGRGATYVFGVWVGIAVASGLAGLIGCLLLQGASPVLIAIITAIAAGAILTMLADTMIPEAFERTHLYTGLIAAIGFMVAFGVERIG
jgi:ZIP family zinc transporter